MEPIMQIMGLSMQLVITEIVWWFRDAFPCMFSPRPDPLVGELHEIDIKLLVVLLSNHNLSSKCCFCCLTIEALGQMVDLFDPDQYEIR